MSDVGRLNIEWILEFCRRAHLTPAIADLGRSHARGVYYFTHSGRVLLRRVRPNGKRKVPHTDVGEYDA
jgi:chemotaxis protein CheD